MNSLGLLSSLPDASGKALLRELGFGYMLSLMVAYTSRIIMQAISARVIGAGGQGSMPPRCTRGNQGLRMYQKQQGSPDTARVSGRSKVLQTQPDTIVE